MKTLNRRHFLRNTAGTVLALTSVRSLFAGEYTSPYIDHMGLQIYTLRDALKTDTPGTFKAVAEAGYKQVEIYGFPNAGPMLEAAKENGLAVNSSHIDVNTIVKAKDAELGEFKKNVDLAHSIGLSHFVIPYVPEPLRTNLDGYKALAEKFNQAAQISKQAGIQLCYHNHNFEFQPMEGGQNGYDIFIAEFSPEMMFEIDVFWVKAAGQEPLELIEKLKGRVAQLHLKDLKKGIEIPTYGKLPEDAFKEIGNGMIPMEPIMAAAQAAGVKHCHVEQDQSPHPIESIQESMRHLKG
ncbi:sugar phosphate isomerase/epimerase family protein [Luteolibacter algae]|uniref:Sugar phosphate isomerase/epimerase family protein n=1 Tax=Luteolibacter algae TaxID=454151 RepID=A0ABW5D3L0_9BACT